MSTCACLYVRLFIWFQLVCLLSFTVLFLFFYSFFFGNHITKLIFLVWKKKPLNLFIYPIKKRKYKKFGNTIFCLMKVPMYIFKSSWNRTLKIGSWRGYFRLATDTMSMNSQLQFYGNDYSLQGQDMWSQLRCNHWSLYQ